MNYLLLCLSSQPFLSFVATTSCSSELKSTLSFVRFALTFLFPTYRFALYDLFPPSRAVSVSRPRLSQPLWSLIFRWGSLHLTHLLGFVPALTSACHHCTVQYSTVYLMLAAHSSYTHHRQIATSLRQGSITRTRSGKAVDLYTASGHHPAVFPTPPG